MALPLTQRDKDLLLSALGLPETRDRVVALLDLAGTGNMTGPGSATDNALVRFDGTTGALVQNSGAIVDDSNNLSGIAGLVSTGQHSSAVGSAAAPTYSFTGDLDTGMYRSAADTLGLSAGGAIRATLATNQLNLNVPIYTTDGSVTEPSISFGLDTNTGIYRVSADVLGITAGGIEKIRFNSTGASLTGQLTTTGSGADITSLSLLAGTTTGTVRQYFRNSDSTRSFEFDADFTGAAETLIIQSDTTTILQLTRGGQQRIAAINSAASPSYSFIADTDSGFYRSADNDLRIATGGSDAIQLTNSVVAIAPSRVLQNENGSVSTPAYSFSSDPDTGVYRIGANNLGVSTGNTKVIDAAATGVSILGTTTNDNAASGFVGEYVSSSANYAAYGGVDAQFTDQTTISLGAGDWDVSAMATVYNANAAGLTTRMVGISTGTAGNAFSDRLDGNNNFIAEFPLTTSISDTGTVTDYRLSLSGTTTVRLKIFLGFAAGTPQIAYRISARRVR